MAIASSIVNNIDAFQAGLLEKHSAAEAELAKYLLELGTMSSQLKQTSTQIENAVMDVCSSFQGIAERSRATVARTTGFLGESAENENGRRSFDSLIRACGESMVRIMNAAEESGELSRRAIERIEQMDQSSARISTALEQLEQISIGNKMLALNLRIEAAHAGESGAGFAGVAVEVGSQIAKTRTVTAFISQLVGDLRELASSTVADLQRMNERDQARVTQCRQDVEGSLEELRSAHAAMKDMLTDVTENGASLAADIGSAVRGLQFQDRVSQRIAHVVEDLDTLRTRLMSRCGPGGSAGAVTEQHGGFSAYTMREERETAGFIDAEAEAGDVELF